MTARVKRLETVEGGKQEVLTAIERLQYYYRRAWSSGWTRWKLTEAKKRQPVAGNLPASQKNRGKLVFRPREPALRKARQRKLTIWPLATAKKRPRKFRVIKSIVRRIKY